MTRKKVGVGAEALPPKTVARSSSPRASQEGYAKVKVESRSLIAVDESQQPDRSNQPRPNEVVGTEFLDNVAHQMVAPLQSIQQNCTSILKGNVPQEKEEARLREVVGHAKILAELARRMRFLHELVSGKKIDTETLDFQQIVTSWIDGFNNYLSATDAANIDVDIAHNAMNKLPSVIASRLAVHQVIMNLYDNAIKYGAPNSKIVIRAKREGAYIVNEFSHKARVLLTAAAAARVGEREFRAEEARKLRASGTGIGMWISKQLMRAMQGDVIALATTEDAITRFRISWRIAQ